MFIFLGILLTVLGFTVIVTIHELGHYFAARAVGVRVHEFGIGIPPRVKTLRVDSRGTHWTLNVLPIGGFVRLEGEEGHSRQSDSLGSRPLWARLFVLLAGVSANFLLAIVLIAFTLPFLDRPLALNTRFPELSQSVLFPTVEEAKSMLWITQSPGVIAAPVSDDVPFARAGGRRGDIIIEWNGQSVTDAATLKKWVSQYSWSLFTVRVIRWEESLSLTVESREGTMGALIANRIEENPDFSFASGPIETVKIATKEVWIQSVFTLHMLAWLVSDLAPSAPQETRQEALEMVGGPIALGWAVVDMISRSAGVSWMLIMAALISVNLAVFNLLPLPALDGGRAVTTTFHSFFSLFPRWLSRFEAIENSWHFLGFAFLILISVVVALKDIFSLITR